MSATDDVIARLAEARDKLVAARKLGFDGVAATGDLDRHVEDAIGQTTGGDLFLGVIAENKDAATKSVDGITALITDVDTTIALLHQAGAPGTARDSKAGDNAVAAPYTGADVSRVADHLSTLDHFEANDVMIVRIRAAIDEGRPLTDGQTNFMRHELRESELMSRGIQYEEAHAEALKTHPPGRNYDPDVIDQSDFFGPWWRRMNRLEPR